jgi:hypothetical protein
VPDHIQDNVAYRIRAELVCCEIYERVRREAFEIDKTRKPLGSPQEDPRDPTDFGMQGAMARAVLRRDWHDICYWGEAAARIAEGQCPGYETNPNICRCVCGGCQHNCSAHIEADPA